MEINEYSKSDCYKRNINLIKEFCDDMGLTSSQMLSDFVFDDIKLLRLPRYWVEDKVFDTYDPDNLRIIKAIYICLWGHLFSIENEKQIGIWGRSKDRQAPFRGDTMNSYNVIKRLCEDESLNNRFKNNYHRIGNFILIPNVGNVNRQKGATRPKGYVQDSFELFLHALDCHSKGDHNLINKVWEQTENKDIIFSKKEGIYFENKDIFCLTQYFKNDVPLHYCGNDINNWIKQTIDIIDSRSDQMAQNVFEKMGR